MPPASDENLIIMPPDRSTKPVESFQSVVPAVGRWLALFRTEAGTEFLLELQAWAQIRRGEASVVHTDIVTIAKSAREVEQRAQIGLLPPALPFEALVFVPVGGGRLVTTSVACELFGEGAKFVRVGPFESFPGPRHTILAAETPAT